MAARLAERDVQVPRLIVVHARWIDDGDAHVAPERLVEQVRDERAADAATQHHDACGHRPHRALRITKWA